MSNRKPLQILGALALGAALAVPAYAATKSPSSVNESAPDKAGKSSKGAAGVPKLPSKGPTTVNESAPSKAGKENQAPMQADSKNMPNPKTPSSVNESSPDKTGKGARSRSTKRSTKSSEGMYK